jgi:MOSC domain-containing protein YiiM
VRVRDGPRLGTALFEVTERRVTCFKFGVRLGEP